MFGMKLSMSLPAEDVSFLDEYVRTHALRSRSAAMQEAIRVLRLSELRGAYAHAWHEWESSGESALWERAAGDEV